VNLRYTNLVKKGLAFARAPRRLLVRESKEMQPLSTKFGFDRGTPIDRKWIEEFISRNSTDQPGRGLEVGGTEYLERFFKNLKPHRLVVTDDGAPNSVVCDLEKGITTNEPPFDILIATQVFNFIFDTRASLRTASSLLKPGGLFIGSVGGISQISRYDADRWGHFYSFTNQSWTRHLRENFSDAQVSSFGNVDSACAYLTGMCAEEVDKSILGFHDPDYPVTICFIARK
jgi:hypothetical protein